MVRRTTLEIASRVAELGLFVVGAVSLSAAALSLTQGDLDGATTRAVVAIACWCYSRRDRR